MSSNAAQNTLSAWLERTNHRTGKVEQVHLQAETFTLGKKSQDLPLTDPEVSDIHAILTRDQHKFVLRDLGSKSGTFVNNRKIVETALTNLDEIRIGRTLFTFRASFLKTSSEKPSASATPASGYVFPHLALLNPQKYWARVNQATLFGKEALPIHLLNVLLFLAACAGLMDSFSAVHLAFLVLAASLGLIASAVTATIFRAPLSNALHFTYGVSPFLLLAQFAFLVLAHQLELRPNHYFLLSLIPTSFFWGFNAFQGIEGLKLPFGKSLGFAITASVPWNLFTTGMLWFIF